MASKVIPALLLVGFLVTLMISFRATPFRSTAVSKLQDSLKSNQAPKMKRYWMVFLKTGPHRDQTKTEAADIQRKHLENIGKLAKAGKLIVAGPFEDDSDLRGIFIMDCKDSLEAASLVQTDPAVNAGRLAFEIKPWWTAKNCLFK